MPGEPQVTQETPESRQAKLTQSQESGTVRTGEARPQAVTGAGRSLR